MDRPSASLLRIAFAFVIVFFAGVITMFIRAISHSQSGALSAITFLAAFICLSFLLQRTFPSLYSNLRRPRPWWQTRAAELPIAIAFALLVSILSSKIATLWFGLLAISAVLIALILRATARNQEPVTLLAEGASDAGSHLRVPDNLHPHLPLKPHRQKQTNETLRPTQRWSKPPFSISDNCAMDVRNLAAVRDWYEEKLGLRDALGEREEDSGRPFVDLHTPESEALLSLVELPTGATAENRHVIFFTNNLEKAHRWLAERGVLVEPITNDSGGNHFFRFHDLEGNTIEVCVEPG
jgi:catechol 2,3-dioxygenase-like lactoylglutathione lyase family enzyme